MTETYLHHNAYKGEKMILDSVENFQIYSEIHRSFKTVLDFLKKTDFSTLPDGKHVVSDGIFAISSRYKTINESDTFIECHRKYIDIQIMVKGSERMGICNRDLCRQFEYNDSEDYQKLEGKLDFITVREGFFTVFYPHDGHMPQLIQDGKPEEVKKIVIKVQV